MPAKDLLKALPHPRPVLFRSFVETYAKGMQKEDFTDHAPKTTLEILEQIWDLGKKRASGESMVATRTVAGVKKGWLHERTRIFLVSDDRAFIVDSVTAELNRRNLFIRALFHPVIAVSRDKTGVVMAVADRDAGGGVNESWLAIEVQGALDKTQRADLEKDLLRVIDDVMAATRDWEKMKARLTACIADFGANVKKQAKTDDIAVDEYQAFLQYLHDNNFTLLGYREYRFTEEKGEIRSDIVKGNSLGLLRDDHSPVYVNGGNLRLPQDLQRLRLTAPLVSVHKINRRSTVHRTVPLDGITIKLVDAAGHTIGEKLFIGLFTSVTYSRSVADVPLIRIKVARAIKAAGFARGSHDHRALAHVLEKYPRDELFQMSVDQVVEHAGGILRLQDRPHVALYPRVDDFRRYISCLVYVPRDRYETNTRRIIQHILEQEFKGVCDNFYTTLDDSPLARVIFIISTDQRARADYDFKVIEHRLIKASRTWPERLRFALMEQIADEKRAIGLARTYDTAFDPAYQDACAPETALTDIGNIENVLATGRVVFGFQTERDGDTILKLYHPKAAAALSDVLPMIENMGFRVEEEFPFEVTPHGNAHTVWIHELHLNGTQKIDIESTKEEAQRALTAVWYGEAENDPLNALVITAGLEWREVVILRTFVKYMQQARLPYTPQYIMKALTDHPTLAAALLGLFHATQDPDLPDAGRNIKAWETAINAGLESVEALDQDRIIRFMKSLVDATLRTNFYQRAADGSPRPVLALKLDSAQVATLPDPRPWREIFVYSPRMEGIHLRGGRIARGGIRWSDRPEDFRTEILGLMQAQMVKNAVIVPEGAKGGFILKKLPENATREDVQAEGVACYKMLIRGMLDVTDNFAEGRIVPPARTIRHDGDDPYLVVAADKGTAKFSDVANALSAEYGFWLGDAFASGGSAGYDHKEIGITARGAWECIKRHFRELGTDIQKEPFDVIGVGDMAGDVFGNGMLLSRTIRLVGAFNHAHIFCDPDPDPDPEKTWKERHRLFEETKAWDGYDQSLLSKGGRIYSRREKSLTLTKEIRDRFGIATDKISPDELISAMIKASCDLLYFGGIGTYIKGDAQTHADANDKANDSCRVNAGEVGARVVGEGANLAVTRRARVELGLRGIKLNADFVDNSGGVDCSDHEVNIKILLQGLMGDKNAGLTLKRRDALLKTMTDEVATLVLRDNQLQSQAISLAELDAAETLPIHARFIEQMERDDGLKRAVEGLPAQSEIEARLRDHKGLTRPELATLIALAKLRIKKALLAGKLIDDPIAEGWLLNYFPAPLRRKYPEAILKHRLRREIVAAQLAASIVNRLGPTFLTTMAEKRGADIETIARASFIARESCELRSLWHGIEALDGKIAAIEQLKAMKYIARLIEATTAWILRHNREMLEENGSLAQTSACMADCIRIIRDTLPVSLPASRKERIAEHLQASKKADIPDDIAARLAHLGPLRSAPDIIRVADRNHDLIPVAATIFFHLGDLMHFDGLRQQARMLSGSSFWQTEAADGIISQLYATQGDLTRRVLEETDKKKPALNRLQDWRDQNAETMRRFEVMLNDMRRLPQLDLAMITLAEQRLRQLCA